MTEDEAKTRWCPFANDRSAPAERKDSSGAVISARCIASACMAWRWHIVEADDIADDARARPVEVWPDLTPYHPPGRKLVRHGLCGLAGKP